MLDKLGGEGAHGQHILPHEHLAVAARARADAKKAKNFAEADRIRDELKAQGIEITDVPGGAKWKRI